MAEVSDPVELANVLLSKTGSILARLERGWQHLNEPSSPNKSPERSKNNEVGKVLSGIQEELRTYRELAGRRIGQSETGDGELIPESDTKDEAFGDRINCDEPLEHISSELLRNKHLPVTSRVIDELTPSARRVSSEHADPYGTFKKPLYSESPQKSSLKLRKRNAWQTELNDKINKLEQELEELRLSHMQQTSNLKSSDRNEERRITRLDSSLVLLDIVSSRSPSPVKIQSREIGKTFRKVDGVSQKQRSTKRTGNIKEKLLETERIMDRGFNTARELNDKLDLLKQKSKKRKDAALQVSMPQNEPIMSSDNESYLYGLVENVTSMLLQQKDLGGMGSSRTPRANTRHVVVTGEDARQPGPHPRQRLAIQRLPDNFIRGELTLQQLPSIHIPPASVGSAAASDNTRVYVVKHPPSPIQKLTRIDSVEDLVREEAPTEVQKRSLEHKTDVGLQVQLSESSEKEMPMEKRIEFLRQKFQNENKLLKGFDENQKLGELFRKVQASRKLCQRFGHLSPTSKASLNVGKDSARCKTPVHSKVSSVPSPLREAQLKSSSMMKSDFEEDYKSDFEVESLVVDNSVENSPSSRSITIRNGSIEAKKVTSGNICTVNVLPSTPPSPLLEPDVNLTGSVRTKHSPPRYPSGSSKIDGNSLTDESIIEEQMKRLGLSPERLTSPRRVLSERPRSVVHNIRTRKTSVHTHTNRLERVSQNGEGGSPNHRTFYVKSDGKYIPVDPLEAPKVQIIVPEIVVKLPESLNPSVACRDREIISHRGQTPVKMKQDQVIQTDEGCGTLTSGETSSVVEKLNKHFERTQLLLERIGGRSNQLLDATYVGQNGLLGLLHRRASASESEDSVKFKGRNLNSWGSPGEVISRPLMGRHAKGKDVSFSQSITSRSEGEAAPEEEEAESGTQSIGEILQYDHR